MTKYFKVDIISVNNFPNYNYDLNIIKNILNSSYDINDLDEFLEFIKQIDFNGILKEDGQKLIKKIQ